MVDNSKMDSCPTIKTGAERARQSSLQTELELLVKQLSQRPGFGQNGVRMYVDDMSTTADD